MSCRFCFESNSPKKNPLISPCECKGTSKYVHRECLLKWQVNTTVEAHKFICQTCQAPYTFPTAEFERIPVIPSSVWVFVSPNVLLSTLHLGYLLLSFFRLSISVSHAMFFVTTLIYGTLYGIQFYQVKRKYQYIGFWALNRTQTNSTMKPITFVFALALIMCVYPAFPYVASIVYCHTLSNLFQIHREILLSINQGLLLEF